jgi:hypothetical protein
MVTERVLDDPSLLTSIRDQQPHVSRNLGPMDDVFSTEIAQHLLLHRGLRKRL